MPTTTSVVAAALSLYDSLTAANFPSSTRPAIYFDDAPQVGSSGSQVRPPYVVLIDQTGRKPEVQSDLGGIESGDIRLEVYANSLGDVDTIVQAIKWNGQPPSSHAGFDCGTLTVTAPYHFMHMLRTGEKRSMAGTDRSVTPIHKCELVYSVMTDFDAGG